MHGTWNPAPWSRNATKSKKFTNWLNTMLFVVTSFLRRLFSSSMSASILEDERHWSKLIRPMIPWRGFAFSSSSRAGASKSIVKGTWQTGHVG